MKRFFVLSAGLLLITAYANAGLLGLPILIPGITTPNTDDLLVSDRSGSNPLGSLFADTGVQSFSFTGSGITTSGTVREVVYREAGGTLDFLMGVNVNTGNLSEVSQVNTGSFVNFQTRVGTLSPVALLGAPGAFFPNLVSRSTGGDTITFTYNNNITSGMSVVMAISTDATNAVRSNIGLIGAGGGTQTVIGFMPTNVPEPATIGLFGAGLIALRVIRKTRRKGEE